MNISNSFRHVKDVKKVKFIAEFNLFEFRVFFLHDRLRNQEHSEPYYLPRLKGQLLNSYIFSMKRNSNSPVQDLNS